MRKYTIFIYIILVHFIGGCSSFTPVALKSDYAKRHGDRSNEFIVKEKKYSNKKYDGIYSVENPGYKKKTSYFGKIINGVSAGLGGVIGYKSDLIQFHNGNEKLNADAVNAVVGGMIGFTVSYLSNHYYNKLGTRKNSYDLKKWLKDSNLEHKYAVFHNNYNTNGYNLSQFIDKRYESKFYPVEYDDIQGFENAFSSNSVYFDDVLVRSNKFTKFSEHLNIIRKYPNTKSSSILKRNLINKASSLDKYYQAIHFCGDNFKNKTKLTNLIHKKNREDLPTLINKYSDENEINIFKKKYTEWSSDIEELLEAKTRYSLPNYDYTSKIMEMITLDKVYLLKGKVSSELYKKALNKTEKYSYERVIKSARCYRYRSQDNLSKFFNTISGSEASILCPRISACEYYIEHSILKTHINLVENLYNAELKRKAMFERADEDNNKRIHDKTVKNRLRSCANCKIDNSKSKLPRTVEGWFSDTRYNGEIIMKNGDTFEWQYNTKKGFYVPGFIFDTKYENWNNMLKAFIKECKIKNCY